MAIGWRGTWVALERDVGDARMFIKGFGNNVGE
jgi:hypothetical protein